MTLQQIHIDLQNRLIQKLVEACKNDHIVDFAILVDESDFGRDRAMTALMELRQRLHQATPIVELDQTTLPNQTETTSRVNTIEDSEKDSPPTSVHKAHRRTVSATLVSLFRKHHVSDTKSSKEDPVERSSEIAEPCHDKSHVLRRLVHSSKSQPQSPAVDALNENPWEEEGNVWQHQDDQQSEIETPATVRPRLEGQPSYTRSFATISHQRTWPGSMLAKPTSENNYLGFCKGAWRMQNGDKRAMHPSQEMDTFQSHVLYLSCSSRKCTFETRLSDEDRRKVHKSGLRLKLRWAFLAKSHIPQSRGHDFSYQCQFCALTGSGHDELVVYRGVDALLEHVASHRGEVLGDVVLDRTCCINDRIAGDDEDFDLNLFPLETEPGSPCAPLAPVDSLMDGYLSAQSSPTQRKYSAPEEDEHEDGYDHWREGS